MRRPDAIFPQSAALALLTSALLLRAAPSPDLRFGVQTHFAQGWSLGWIPRAVQGGISTVRDELYWSSIEPSPGQYVFPASYDSYMAGLSAAGVSPLIELDFANPNYDAGNTPCDAAGITGYANYAAQILQHYGAQITAVEVWNEFDGTFCSGPAAQNRPAAYENLLAAAYGRIKALRPDVTVAGGSTAWVDLPFFQQLFAAGGLSSLDVLSLHPYRYTSPPEGLENDIAGLQTLTRLYNGGQTKPIWVTEIGWYPHVSSGPADAAITDTVEAAYLVRSYALLLSAGVSRVYWYALRDNPEIDNGEDLGLLPESISAPAKPAYTALAAMIQQLAGAAFVRREGAPNQTYSLLFQRADGTQVRVLWATMPRAVYLQGATGAVDLFGRPVATSGAVSLGPSPIFVTGPVTGLPNQAGTVLADSLRDFSASQGANGWTLGYTTAGANFTAAPSFQLRNTAAPQWTAPFPWFSITASDQLPSSSNSLPVAAVRRWTSPCSGRVELTGQFSTEQQGGDGVGVSIALNGRPLFRKILGGGAATTETFDVTQTITAGTTVDFVVDPGPGTDNSYDATAVAAKISSDP